jgi:hypothetical protein
LIVQVPAVKKVSAPTDVMVHTLVVDDVKVGVRPESDVAVSVGLVPKFCDPGFANVMVWPAFGVTELEALDAGPVPAELLAVTVKVYACPLVSPVTTIGEFAPLTGATSAGEVVTVYPEMDMPPVLVGALKATLACVSPAVAAPMVGAPGATGLTVKDLTTCGAGRKELLPA